MLTVQKIDSKETRSLRHLVLWPHIQDVSDCIIDIDDRADAIHLGAFVQDEIVGVCSLFEMSSPRLEFNKQYRLRAMATHPKVRGEGAGMAIVDEAKSIISELGYEVLWCDARKIALGFYSKQNFKEIDEWYEVRNIGLHKTMFYKF